MTGGGPCAVRSHVQRRAGARANGALYSEVQCIMGDGHIGPP